LLVQQRHVQVGQAPFHAEPAASISAVSRSPFFASIRKRSTSVFVMTPRIVEFNDTGLAVSGLSFGVRGCSSSSTAGGTDEESLVVAESVRRPQSDPMAAEHAVVRELQPNANPRSRFDPLFPATDFDFTLDKLHRFHGYAGLVEQHFLG
jgi:hypothetical protein